MLERIRLWQDLAPIVLHHHEHFDGRGYPDGLAGEAIPLEARIIAVCEAFDVMVSPSYKGALRSPPRCTSSRTARAGNSTRIVELFDDLVARGVIEPASS